MSKHAGRRTVLPGIPLLVPPPGQDPLETVLRSVDATVDPEGWDQPSSLFWVYEHGQPAGLMVKRPPIRQAMGRLYPPDMLNGLAATVHLSPWATVPELHGVAVVTEGWAAVVHKEDHAGFERAHADAVAHRIRHRPDRIEVRQVTLVAVSGREMALTRFRGDEYPMVVATDSTGGEGLVLEALRRLVAAASKGRH